jgi:electron transport complex protein RnfD
MEEDKSKGELERNESPLSNKEEKYIVTSSPHILGKETVPKIMWTVNICLAPAGLASIYIFGWRALFIILLSVASAVSSEYLWQKLTKRKITIHDGSAFLTGLLLGYSLSPDSSWWLPILGGIFAIIIVKQLFGGLGMNIFNPALASRGFLQISFPQEFISWLYPVMGLGITASINTTTDFTPLEMLKRAATSPDIAEKLRTQFPDPGEMFDKLLWGIRAGGIGEVCSIMLIIGGLYLIYKKYIDWQVPSVFIGATALFTLIFGGGKGVFNDPLSILIFHTFSGSLILGSIFMATDFVTTPSTLKGRIIFALGCSLLTGIIRLWGGYPDGVYFAILIMNAFTPIIDDKVKTKVYGTRREQTP